MVPDSFSGVVSLMSQSYPARQPTKPRTQSLATDGQEFSLRKVAVPHQMASPKSTTAQSVPHSRPDPP